MFIDELCRNIFCFHFYNIILMYNFNLTSFKNIINRQPQGPWSNNGKNVFCFSLIGNTSIITNNLTGPFGFPYLSPG